MYLINNVESIKKVSWSSIRNRIQSLNPELVSALEAIKYDFAFYIVRYPFGTSVNEKGLFALPQADGTTKNIADSDTPAALRKDLDYLSINSTPVGMVLTHGTELSLQREGQHIPWIIMTPGRIFGLWRTLDKEFPHSYHSQDAWYMKAGLQHGFVLPKIAIATAYKKLAKARGLSKNNPPRDLFDHYAIFKEMSEHKDFSQPWYTEILYFSKSWLTHLPELPQLELFFYKTMAQQSRFWRNKNIFDFMWNSFIYETTKANISVKSHIFDIAKHILMVALGALPSFAPAMDNTSGPIQGIQRDLLDIYGLKAAPVIMIPTYFDMYDPKAQPTYWSLQFPCYLESVPNPKTRGSHLDDLDQIAHLLEYLFEMVEHKRLAAIINTPIEYCLQHVKFEFFHSDAKQDDPWIRPSYEMPQEDSRLVQCLVPGRENEVFEFSEVSPFVRGCIRFSLRHAEPSVIARC